MFKLLCCFYIAMIFGIACGSVGEIPKEITKPYEWYMPFEFLIIFSIPAVFSYLAGSDDASNKNG